MPGPQQEQFLARVQQLTEGSPYAATATERGFDVHLEIAAAHWRTLLMKQSIEKTYTFRVTCDEADHTYAVTDIARDSQRGAFGGSVSKSWSSGSTQVTEFGRVYAWDDDRGPSEVVNYYFDAGEGHALIRRAATELGWTEVRGTTAKVARGFAIIGALIAVVVVVLVVVLVVLL